MLFESLIQTMDTEKVLIEKKAHPIFLLICFNKGILLLKDCLNQHIGRGKGDKFYFEITLKYNICSHNVI